MGRNLPQLARDADYEPGQVAALERILETPNWSGVSWLYHWGWHGAWYLRRLCRTAADSLAEDLGLGDALLERFVPDFGLATGPIELPYGGRGPLRLRLDSENQLHALLSDRPVRSLPPPLVRDDPAAIRSTRQDVRLVKREIARAAKLVRHRIDRSHADKRVWTPAQWRSLMRNPVYRNVAGEYLWAAYGEPGNRLRHLLAIDETGELVTSDNTIADLYGLIIRRAESFAIAPSDRRRWGIWFGEHERTLVELLDEPSDRHETVFHSVPFYYFSHLDVPERRRARAAFVDLGWDAHHWPSKPVHFVGSPWVSKRLGAGELRATIVADGSFLNLRHVHLIFTPAPVWECEESDWLRPADVPRPLHAEVQYDLASANRVLADHSDWR